MRLYVVLVSVLKEDIVNRKYYSIDALKIVAIFCFVKRGETIK